MFLRLMVLCCLIAFLSPVWAEEAVPVMMETVLSPSGHVGHALSLDDPQPDTLAYDNGAIQSFYQNANMWSRVRFTAPDSFEVRSVYFIANNPIASASPCSIFVHSSVGGNMGPQLTGGRIQGNVVHFTDFNVPVWNDQNFPTPVSFGPGEDFFVVIGPAPGGVQGAGWHILLDAGSVGRSAYTFPTRMGNYTPTANGDWLMRVGGAAAAFVDVASDECYNENAAGDPKFQMLSGEQITLQGSIHNNGNTDVDLLVVSWFIRNSGGQTVFTNEITTGPLAEGVTSQVSASESYTMTTNGEYMAGCVVGADDDALAANDTSWLRMFVGPLHRWFRYDDNGEADGYTSFTPGNGWGVSFEPVAYTAAIESLRVNVGGAGASDLSIWLNDGDGLPTTSVWSDTPVLAQGWNTVAVNPPVNIFEGETFTIGFLYTTLSLGADANLPNVGEQPHMGTISWQYEGAWGVDNSGNWCLQAYLDSTNAVPSWPVIDTNLDTMQFGQVDTAAAGVQQTLWIYNEGGGDPLSVTNMVINPPGIRSAYSLSRTTMTVAAGDSEDVIVTFNPPGVANYNGIIQITNNSNNEPQKNVVIRGQGVALDADDPLEMPAQFELSQNFPNPFNPSTEITFALPQTSDVRLGVFNMLGQQVDVLAAGTFSAGYHTVSFDATELPAGLYFYRIEAGDFTAIRKMMLLK